MFKYFFKDIGLTIWSSIPLGLIFAIGLSAVAPQLKEKGVKTYVSDFFKGLKADKEKRYKFYFLMYFFMLFNRTVLSREPRYKPFEAILGGWKIVVRGYTGLDAQVVGNIMIFVPFTFLMLLAFSNLRKTTLGALKNGICYSLLMSAGIEACQTIFLKGTLQIADLILNFGGAIIGSILFIIINYIISKKKHSK